MFNIDSYLDEQEHPKVKLFHISSVDPACTEEVLDLGLDFIWRTMHCGLIKVFLHHYKNQDGKMKVNMDIKKLLKDRRFKWKQLKNDSNTGYRIEILEVGNLDHQEQLKPDSAFIFRRGLE